MRPSGALQSPTTGSLEAMLREADREDQLAEFRLQQKNAMAQITPPSTSPGVFPATAPAYAAANATSPVNAPTTANAPAAADTTAMNLAAHSTAPPTADVQQ